MPTPVGALPENNDTNAPEPGTGGDLVSWVMDKVNKWRDDRDQTYEKVWGEYYRLWRGRHIDADKTRSTERSRLVSPALAQALEMSVAELEEATFGRDAWIDVIDDAGDPDHSDIDGMRQQFLDDLAWDKVPDAIGACYMNGGLWGTLAGKVVVEKQTVPTVMINSDGTSQVIDEPRIAVKVVPIPPMELIPDPDGEYVEDMLGIAHEVTKPRAWLLTKPYGRKYANSRNVVPNHTEDKIDLGDPETLLAQAPNEVLVTEYHGLIPKKFLTADTRSALLEALDPLASAIVSDAQVKVPTGKLDGDGEMVEAIVTIFDKKTLGRAVENPFLMRDRSIVMAPYEKVPGRAWGRGVMEKGYNPQKALDAEIRTRMDVMALIANPMLGADQTALPRGFDMRVRPGKVWMTNASPKEALYPISFPNLDPSSFNQSSEMERMVQMGTGAMDTATPLEGNRRNETATGTSLIAGTFVKRSKRSLRTITNNFLNPLIQKILWRRMDYDSDRYPQDLRFRISSTLGIVARELEQSQITNLLGLVPDKPATQSVLVNAMFDNSSSPYKAQLTEALAQDAQPDPMQQQIQQLQLQGAQIEVADAGAGVQLKQADTAKRMAEVRKIESDIVLNMVKIEQIFEEGGRENQKLEMELGRLQIELEEVRQFARQIDVSEFKAISDARKSGETSGNTND